MSREEVIRIVLVVGSLLVGIVGLLGAMYFVRLSRRSRTWPTVHGVVTYSRVVTVPSTRYSLPYQARIGYRYKVGERSYIATGVSLNAGAYRSRSEAEEVTTRYPVGKQVTVYYDPEDPVTAVLEPGGGLDLSALVGVTGVLGLLIALWIWYAW